MQRVEPYLNTEQGYEKLLIQNQNVGDILQSYQTEEIPRYFKMDGRIFNAEEYPELASVLNTIGCQDTDIEVHEHPFYKNDIFYCTISNTEMHIITRTYTSREMHALKIFFTEEGLFSNVIEVNIDSLTESLKYASFSQASSFFVVGISNKLYKFNLNNLVLTEIDFGIPSTFEDYSFRTQLSFFTNDWQANVSMYQKGTKNEFRLIRINIIYPVSRIIILRPPENIVSSFYRIETVTDFYCDENKIVLSCSPLLKEDGKDEYYTTGNGIIKIPLNITEMTLSADEFMCVTKNALISFPNKNTVPVNDILSNVAWKKIKDKEIIWSTDKVIVFFENEIQKYKILSTKINYDLSNYSSYIVYYVVQENFLISVIQVNASPSTLIGPVLVEKQPLIWDDSNIIFSNYKKIFTGYVKFNYPQIHLLSSPLCPFGISNYKINIMLSPKYSGVPIETNTYIKT